MAMAGYLPQMQLGYYNSPYPGQSTMPMAGYSPQMQLGYNNSPYPGQGTMQMNGYPQNMLFGNYNNPNPVSGNSLMAQGFTTGTDVRIFVEGNNNNINIPRNPNERLCSCMVPAFDQSGYCAECGGSRYSGGNMHIQGAVRGNKNTITFQ